MRSHAAGIALVPLACFSQAQSFFSQTNHVRHLVSTRYGNEARKPIMILAITELVKDLLAMARDPSGTGTLFKRVRKATCPSAFSSRFWCVVRVSRATNIVGQLHEALAPWKKDRAPGCV